MEILLVIFIPIILWIASIYMLYEWRKFKPFFIANAILLIVYLTIIIYGNSTFWKPDVYGLGMLFRLSVCLISHVLIVFVFAIIKRQKLKKTIANNTYK